MEMLITGAGRNVDRQGQAAHQPIEVRGGERGERRQGEGEGHPPRNAQGHATKSATDKNHRAGGEGGRAGEAAARGGGKAPPETIATR